MKKEIRSFENGNLLSEMEMINVMGGTAGSKGDNGKCGNNGSCLSNGSCYNNGTCYNNGNCDGNGNCIEEEFKTECK